MTSDAQAIAVELRAKLGAEVVFIKIENIRPDRTNAALMHFTASWWGTAHRDIVLGALRVAAAEIEKQIENEAGKKPQWP